MATNKQELAAKKIVALKLKNRGKKGVMGKAMIAAGYSPETAKNPKQNLEESKAWPELIEKYLPDENLLKAPQEALEATKWNDFTGEREADHNIRLKSAELGLKIKGRMAETQINQQFNVGEQKIIVLDGGEANYDGLRKQKGN